MRVIVLFLFSLALAAQDWTLLRFLAGEWTGEGSGDPGKGAGGFSFQFDLDRKIMVRKNRADYPATKDRPASSHEDLMVVYPEGGGFRAIYFDNEGHVIRYAVQASPDAAVFLSEPSPREPRYRLTYSQTGPGRVAIKFEIASPVKPEEFKTYIEASAQRKR